jgi:oxygen-independent coproporphyrinogen-3 oxidase
MLTEYLRRTREGISPVATSEEDQEDLLRRKEGLMLGLRLSSGVPFDTFEEISSLLPSESISRLEDAFVAGLLEHAGGRVRLTRRGVLLSNEVFSLLV